MATRVLYISYDGMTDALGQSQVIPYLIGLTKQGYSFTLLSCEKAQNFQQHQSKIKHILSSNNIDWHPITYTKQPPVFSTVYDVLRLMYHAKKICLAKQIAIVHCRSYIAALVGLKMKKQLGVHFIFDMRGLWADERVDGKLWNLKNPIFKAVYSFFKKKEIQFLQQADYTISLTHNAKNEIHTWRSIPNNPVKMEVIPCCADLDLFNKDKIDTNQLNTLKSSLHINATDYVLLYLGSIGTWYMLEEMMEFFSVLKQQKPKAKFLFVTKDEKERILKTAEKYAVVNDIIIRPGNREEIPYLISLAHYSIFFILPSYSKKASSPTKQGEIMAMGIPIICNTQVGDTDKIVQDYHSGILVNQFNQTAYQTAINEMEKSLDATAIIAGATDYFSLENGVKKYAAVYAHVLAH